MNSLKLISIVYAHICYLLYLLKVSIFNKILVKCQFYQRATHAHCNDKPRDKDSFISL